MSLFDYFHVLRKLLSADTMQSLRMVPEKWSFCGGTEEDNGILGAYLDILFRGFMKKGKILESENYAIFNTGLFNRYYPSPSMPIFIPNQVPDGQRWFPGRVFIRSIIF